MRCYFNLINDNETLLDDEGVEVRDLDQAWAQALKAIAELREEAEIDITEWERWRLEAIDSTGKILFSLNLTHGLH
jgi:hypothetical protein